MLPLALGVYQPLGPPHQKVVNQGVSRKTRFTDRERATHFTLR